MLGNSSCLLFFPLCCNKTPSDNVETREGSNDSGRRKGIASYVAQRTKQYVHGLGGGSAWVQVTVCYTRHLAFLCQSRCPAEHHPVSLNHFEDGPHCSPCPWDNSIGNLQDQCMDFNPQLMGCSISHREKPPQQQPPLLQDLQ